MSDSPRYKALNTSVGKSSPARGNFVLFHHNILCYLRKCYRCRCLFRSTCPRTQWKSDREPPYIKRYYC